MAGVEGFTVGGAVHIIVNNLIGFTTDPPGLAFVAFFVGPGEAAAHSDFPRERGRSGRGGARGHDGARLPLRVRDDVVVDLIGYRRHGHSEVDDPTITQPLRYRKIEAHPPLWQMYAEKTGVDATADRRSACARNLDAAQKNALEHRENPPMRQTAALLGRPTRADDTSRQYEVETGVARERADAQSAKRWCAIPKDSTFIPK